MLPQLVLDLITCFTGFANHRVLLEVIPLASPCYLLQPASAQNVPLFSPWVSTPAPLATWRRRVQHPLSAWRTRPRPERVDFGDAGPTHLLLVCAVLGVLFFRLLDKQANGRRIGYELLDKQAKSLLDHC